MALDYRLPPAPSREDPRDVDPHVAKARGRALDSCLLELEEAALRGETTVSDRVATRLSALPAIEPGMAIFYAQELVFQEQGRWLTLAHGPSPDLDGPAASLTSVRSGGIGNPPASTMTAADARALTDRIRARLGEVSLALLEAHDRRAWAAIGYGSWADYVSREFGLSRSRSYELLDHARISIALGRAAGLSGPATITPRTACRIKPAVPALLVRLRKETAGLEEAEARSRLDEMLADRSSQIALLRGRPSVVPAGRYGGVGDARGSRPGTGPAAFREAISILVSLQAPAQVIRSASTADRKAFEMLPAALAYLNEFAAELDRSHQIRSLAQAAT